MVGGINQVIEEQLYRVLNQVFSIEGKFDFIGHIDNLGLQFE